MKPDLPEDERDSSATNKPEAEATEDGSVLQSFQVSSLEPDEHPQQLPSPRKMGIVDAVISTARYLRDVCIFDGTPLTEFMCLRYLD